MVALLSSAVVVERCEYGRAGDWSAALLAFGGSSVLSQSVDFGAHSGALAVDCCARSSRGSHKLPVGNAKVLGPPVQLSRSGLCRASPNQDLRPRFVTLIVPPPLFFQVFKF